MKILTLCYEYPPLGGGGGRVAQTVARQLVVRGHEVRVQTAALGWRSVEEDDKGVRVFRTASGRAKADTCRVHEMGLYCMTSFLPALRCVRKWKPDVIHAHFAVPTGFLAYALHKFTQVPYVLTAHLGDVPGGVPEQTNTLFRLVNPIARRVWRDAAACTAVSTFVKELAERAYKRPVERILNGIDLVGTLPEPQSDPHRRHLVFVGRLSVQKNPGFLIPLLAGMQSLPWELTVVGDGPLMPELRELVARHHLDARVCFRGWLDAEAVTQVLSESDILLMPSLSEGLPVAAIEALRHGLAIVASDIPGVRDVVDDSVNGFRAAVNDTAEWARKLGGMLENCGMLSAMRRASREKVRAFDLTSVVSQYDRVLRDAAGVDAAAKIA